jgi:hypothetical protein
MAFSHYYCSCYLSFPLACIKEEVLDVQAWNSCSKNAGKCATRGGLRTFYGNVCRHRGILLLCGVIRVLRSNTNGTEFSVLSLLRVRNLL